MGKKTQTNDSNTTTSEKTTKARVTLAQKIQAVRAAAESDNKIAGGLPLLESYEAADNEAKAEAKRQRKRLSKLVDALLAG